MPNLGEGQRIEHGCRHPAGVANACLRARPENLPEIGTLYIFHDEVGLAFVHRTIIDADNARMFAASRQPRFVLKPHQKLLAVCIS